jgi:hypothetical protein
MKQEELKKDYVLLSKIAKEKKYAQEYLGLLARRGDIGSIRIGKRWYTTREWFSEFLADAEAKKAEIKIAKVESAPVEFNISEKIEIAKVFSPFAEEVVLHNFSKSNELKKNIIVSRENAWEEKKVAAADLKNNMNLEKYCAKEERAVPEKKKEGMIEIRKTRVAPIVTATKHPFQVQARNNFEATDLVRKADSGSSRAVRIKNNLFIRPQYVSDISGGAGPRKISREKKVAPKNISTRRLEGPIAENILSRSEPQKLVREEKPFRGWKLSSKGASPNFASGTSQISLFQKFAFSVAVVLLLVLIFQFGLVFKDDIKKIAGLDSGVVAGAEDSQVGLSDVKDSSLEYLANQKGKVRESISLSRVLIRAALEREKVEIK